MLYRSFFVLVFTVNCLLPISLDKLAQDYRLVNWSKLPKAPLPSATVIRHPRVSVLFKKDLKSLELYYQHGNELSFSGGIIPIGQNAAGDLVLSSARVLNRDNKGMQLHVVFKDDSGNIISFDLNLYGLLRHMELVPRENCNSFRIRMKSRYLILPDYFADDLLLSPDKIGDAVLNIPPDNHFLLGLVPGGGAILMAAWQSAQQQVSVRCRKVRSGDNEYFYFSDTEIKNEPGSSVCLALLSAERIWKKIKCEDYVIFEDKKIPWRIPFHASWRMLMTRSDESSVGNTESWWLLYKNKQGRYQAPVKEYREKNTYYQNIYFDNHANRRIWYSQLGHFTYPVYISGSTAYLRIPRYRDARYIRYAGEIVIYPLERSDHTPDKAVTPVDVLSDYLGVDYGTLLGIQDLQKFNEDDTYYATCHVTETTEKIIEAKKSKARRDYIIKLVNSMNKFVRIVRGRIDDYAAWAGDLEGLLTRAANDHPEHKAEIKKLSRLPIKLMTSYGTIKPKIKNPSHVHELASEMLQIADGSLPYEQAVSRSQELGRSIRKIGGCQDNTVALYRIYAKKLRQQATRLYLMTDDRFLRKTAWQVRRSTYDILRTKIRMEGK